MNLGAQPAVRGLAQPWAGGLNACHFAPLGSGYIAFDRVGERVRYFDASWRLVPGVEDVLPPLKAWVQTHDFNGDGREDIFTFNGISGITVYKNIGAGPDCGFAFERYTEALMTEMFGQQVQLYCISEDYPVIEDIDGDGDWDVLNFWVPSSGDFLLFYKNYAWEELGRTDTFILRVADWSWGCFVENEESNEIFLDSCSWREPYGAQASGPASPHGVRTSRSASPEPKGSPIPKHSGSTIFPIKNEQTGLFDIVLGDVGYPDLYYLQNGGTPDKARIIKYDTFFPYTTPVHLHHFPVMSRVRVGDTLCYVYSPYQSNGLQAEGSQSVWRYKDTGGAEPGTLGGALYAQLLEKDFLQNTMVDVGSGAYPVLYDYDGDGLQDLVIGNYGSTAQMVSSLSLYKNVGTAGEPAFEWVTDDYLDLKQYGFRALVPAFADIDGDGTDEMVLGMADGRLWLFKEVGKKGAGGDARTPYGARTSRSASSEPLRGSSLTLLDDNFLPSPNRRFSAPVFFDLNQDGQPELIVGERKGTLAYYEKEADREVRTPSARYGARTSRSASPSLTFSLKTENWGGVDVTDRTYSNFGYAKPCFYQGEDGHILLAVGNENGQIYLYDSIEYNLDGTFRFLGKAVYENKETGGPSPRLVDVGVHAAPLLCDANGDGCPELIVGNQCGGLEYFDALVWSASVEASVRPSNPAYPLSRPLLQAYPNPFPHTLQIDASKAGSYCIIDLQGRIVATGKLRSGSNTLSLYGFPKGMYVLNFENGKCVLKLLKL